MSRRRVLSRHLPALIVSAAAAGLSSAQPVEADNRDGFELRTRREMTAGSSSGGGSGGVVSSELVQRFEPRTGPDGEAGLAVTPLRAAVGVGGAGVRTLTFPDTPPRALPPAGAQLPAGATVEPIETPADVDLDSGDANATLENEEADEGSADNAGTAVRVTASPAAFGAVGATGEPVQIDVFAPPATPGSAGAEIGGGNDTAAVTTFRSAPMRFTTADGDTVVMRVEGFTATDTARGRPAASGTRAVGQAVTAAGELVPFAFQQSVSNPSAPGLADPSVAALRAGFAQPLTGVAAAGAGADAPPAWLSQAAAVADGVSAAARAVGAGVASTPNNDTGNPGPAAASEAAALANARAAAALADAATVAAVGADPGGVPPAGPAGDTPGDPFTVLTAAAAAAFAPDATGPDTPGGVNPPAGPEVSPVGVAGVGPRPAPAGSARFNDPIARALGSGPAAGGDPAAVTALGQAVAFFGRATGERLPTLSSQVVINDAGSRAAVANATQTQLAAGGSLVSAPLVAPPGQLVSGGLVPVTIPQGNFTFSIYDSGGIDNEDVLSLFASDVNGPAVVTAAGPDPVNGGVNGVEVTLFFLTDGQGTTFNEVSNPSVPNNQFTTTLQPGPARVGFSAISSTFGPNTAAIEITSPVTSGPTSQSFSLPQFPPAGGIGAVLDITVAP
ncbi:MAG: hypothetical protein AAF710_11285 [Planctomycetota bacterium]